MSELHALLIGIDAYLPNRIEGVGYYPYLQGCVRDVARVETYLRTGLPIPLAGIDKLTATAVPGSGKPAEPEDWPTYGNMVAAFERLTAAANPGDPVYIHYFRAWQPGEDGLPRNQGRRRPGRGPGPARHRVFGSQLPAGHRDRPLSEGDGRQGAPRHPRSRQLPLRQRDARREAGNPL